MQRAQANEKSHAWLRLPGVFRRIEFQDVIEVEHEFFVEEVGEDEAGVALYRIYCRLHEPDGGGEPPTTGAAAMARTCA
jgi:hypothetical protein